VHFISMNHSSSAVTLSRDKQNHSMTGSFVACCRTPFPLPSAVTLPPSSRLGALFGVPCLIHVFALPARVHILPACTGSFVFVVHAVAVAEVALCCSFGAKILLV
jgi:hypothetical protein